MCGGRVDHIHALFCAIAEHNGKPPMPSQIMAAMLDLTPVRALADIYHTAAVMVGEST